MANRSVRVPIPEEESADLCCEDMSFNSISSSTATWYSSLSSSSSTTCNSGSSSARSSLSCDKSPLPLPFTISLTQKKPHKANDRACEAIGRVSSEHGSIGLSQFRLIKKIGSGDIGKVYMCHLKGFPDCTFAMKIVDREALQLRNKLHRAEAELRILSTLDHPFLPTLYAHFHASHYSCLVMDFASQGDLHFLRLRQPKRRFDLATTRFYAAEVLVALEYLHMMGIVYRDLKPENVLVKQDGHIMLSDFDLSFTSHVTPTLVHAQASPSPPPSPRRWFFPFKIRRSRRRKKKSRSTRPATEDVVGEPWDARSRSMVGTHEYVAPEVISGGGHGSAVDWWALGVLIYEMLYGHTPFRGPTKESTLQNIMCSSLAFPADAVAAETEAEAARDLLRRLLVKDPSKRLGSARGAADIKRHPFFRNVDWPLIRSTVPPLAFCQQHPRNRNRYFQLLRRTMSSTADCKMPRSQYQQSAAGDDVPALPSFEFF